MSDYIKVEGHSNLLRDGGSTAIVNNDVAAYRLQKRRKEIFKNQVKEINTLKDDVTEIKALLHTLIEKIHG
jgi:hypothetical protein